MATARARTSVLPDHGSGAPILLVDDNAVKRLSIRAILGSQHDVIEAESGEDALRAVLKRTFAVILMDVQMPLMNGYETARLIRMRQESEHTPIIFITADGETETGTAVRIAYASGAVDFIAGAIIPAVLRAKVSVFAELHRQSLELKRQRRQLEEAESLGGFGSWEHDLVTGERVWSAGMFRLLGAEPCDEPMPLDQLLAFVHPDDQAALAAARQPDGSASLEYRVRRHDRGERVLHARHEVITAEDGTPLRMLGTEQDITERRAAERAKDEFTSMVSHELRTPLTSIRGSLGLLESGVLGATSRQEPTHGRDRG